MKERNDVIAYLLDAHMQKDAVIASLQAQLKEAQDELAAMKSQGAK